MRRIDDFRVRVGVGVSVGVFTCLAAMPLAAQSCSLMPSDENQLWVGAQYASGAQAGFGGISLGLDLFNRVHLGGAVTFGGYDTGRGSATGRSGEIGVPLRFGSAHGCPTAVVAATSFWFRDRFDADLGRVTEFRGGVRLPVAAPPARIGSIEVRVLGSVDVTWRHLESASRTLETDSGVTLELDDRLDEETFLEGFLGVRARTGSMGLTLGVANRVLDRRRFLPLVQIGVRVG